MMDLFRQLASIMNETAQHASVAETENQKVQSFTALSNSLSQISQPATAAVAPGLMAAITAHQQAQERADAGFAKVGSLWGEIISSAAAGLAAELDMQVNDALGRLRRDAKVVVDEMVREALRKEPVLAEEEDVKPVIPLHEDAEAKAAGKRKSVVLEHEDESRKRARTEDASTPVSAPVTLPPQGPAVNEEMLKLMQAMMTQLQQSTTTAAPATSSAPAATPSTPARRATPPMPASYSRKTPHRRTPPPPSGPHGYTKPSYERPSRQSSNGYEYDAPAARDTYAQHAPQGGHRPPASTYPMYNGYGYYERDTR
jgi:hypothetical protein